MIIYDKLDESLFYINEIQLQKSSVIFVAKARVVSRQFMYESLHQKALCHTGQSFYIKEVIFGVRYSLSENVTTFWFHRQNNFNSYEFRTIANVKFGEIRLVGCFQD